MHLSKVSLRTSLVLLSTLRFCWAVEAADLEKTPDLGSPALADEGRAQFAQNCVYCHGNGGTGGKAGPIAGRDDLTADYIFQTITNGKRAGSLVMPSWKESIDVPTRWALVAYVMSLRAKP